MNDSDIKHKTNIEKYIDRLILEILNNDHPIILEKDNINFLISDMHNKWANNGGLVLGKKRNSVRKLIELLGENQIKSLRPKLSGSTRLTKNDALLLIDAFLKNWNYIETNDEYTAIVGKDLAEIDDDKIQKIAKTTVEKLFSSAGTSTGIRILSRDKDKFGAKPLDKTDKIIFREINESYALINVSREKAAVGPNRTEIIKGFIQIISDIYEKHKNREDFIIIWITDYGMRRSNVDLDMSFFENTEDLASNIRAVAMFEYRDNRKIWKWLKSRSVVISGGLTADRIDDIYRHYKTNVPDGLGSTTWPSLNASHVFPRSIPDSWVKESGFRQLYGRKLERVDEATLTVFVQKTNNNAVSENGMKYFLHSLSREASGEMIPRGVRVESPGEEYDRSFRIAYSAACCRLNLNEMLDGLDPHRTLEHLRHCGFVVLLPDEFLDVYRKLIG